MSAKALPVDNRLANPFKLDKAAFRVGTFTINEGGTTPRVAQARRRRTSSEARGATARAPAARTTSSRSFRGARARRGRRGLADRLHPLHVRRRRRFRGQRKPGERLSGHVRGARHMRATRLGRPLRRPPDDAQARERSLCDRRSRGFDRGARHARVRAARQGPEDRGFNLRRTSSRPGTSRCVRAEASSRRPRRAARAPGRSAARGSGSRSAGGSRSCARCRSRRCCRSARGAHLVADLQPRRVLEVRVPVVAPRALAADDHDVAVEDRVVAGADDAAAAGGDDRRAAGRVDVEALVPATPLRPRRTRRRRRDRRAARGSGRRGCAG